jgi:hypothetical protein
MMLDGRMFCFKGAAAIEQLLELIIMQVMKTLK